MAAPTAPKWRPSTAPQAQHLHSRRPQISPRRQHCIASPSIAFHIAFILVVQLALQLCYWESVVDPHLSSLDSTVAMASDGPTLERSGEVRERPSLEGQQAPHHDATGLQRTSEIHETQSGNVELRKDPDHTSKPLANPEQILDPRGASVASKPEDILAVRRAVDVTDTPLE